MVSATVTQPLALTLGIANTTLTRCSDSCGGSIAAVVSGGVQPYLFSWNSYAGTNGLATGLCKGLYAYTVTDNNGCMATRSDSVRTPAPIVITSTAVNPTCSNTANGSISISVTGGTSAYTYSWTGPVGYNGTTQNPTSIYGGTYILNLQDANACPAVDTTILTPITTVKAITGSDTTLCFGTAYTLSGTNSINAQTYAWYLLPFYNQVGNFATSIVNPSVGANNYVLVATNGSCADTSAAVILTVNPLPVVNAGSVQSIFTLQSATLGGTPTTTAVGSKILWTPSSVLSDSTAPNPTANPLSTTVFKVTVTDLNGCIATDTVTLVVNPEIHFSSGFTPNNDGKNDTWIIDDIQKFLTALVQVYNRWGELVFSAPPGYPEPWDGKYNGENLPVGTYYFVINLNSPLFPKPYTGPITIIR